MPGRMHRRRNAWKARPGRLHRWRNAWKASANEAEALVKGGLGPRVVFGEALNAGARQIDSSEFAGPVNQKNHTSI